MNPFVDAGALSLGAGLGSRFSWNHRGLVLVASVPLNNQLASITDPAEAIAFWPQYLKAWTTRNHLLASDTFCRGALSRLTVNHRKELQIAAGLNR